MKITKIKVKMEPIAAIVQKLGVDRDGSVQKFLTNSINRRMTRYMAYRTGTLATDDKFVAAPDRIDVISPYARAMYYPNVMVNAKTGKGPGVIPGVGPRFRKGTILKPSDRKWDYATDKNPKAGPYWDKRLMAAEGEAIAAEVTEFAKR